MDKKEILEVGVTNAQKGQILEFILDSLEHPTKNYYITTPNPEILVYAHHHRDFLDILNRSKIALADGVGLLFAAQIEAKPLKGRTTGVEMLEMLCQKASKKPVTVGFLGGQGKIAEVAAQCLAKKYPGLRVVLARGWDPTEETAYRLEKDIENYFHTGKTAGFSAIGHEVGEAEEGIEELGSPKLYQKESKDNSSDVIPPKAGIQSGSRIKSGMTNHMLDILFVAYGHPKQEYFMSQYIDRLPVKVMMGVGGALDYIGGAVPRAPHWMRALGLEWLYRLVRQPWRMRRQLALVEFIYLIFKEKLVSK